MKLKTRPQFSLLLLAGAVALTADATAQVVPRQTRDHRGAPQTSTAQPGLAVVPSPQGPVTQSVANASVTEMLRNANVATSGLLDGVPLLNGFRFRFTNGDHELRRVGVIAAGTSSANIAFYDQNGDDPFNAAASWIVLRGVGRRGTVVAAGDGQFDIPLPETRPPGHRLVITGFDFQREYDKNLRSVGIWLDEGRNVARVTFFDDRGFNGPTGQVGSNLGDAGLLPHPERGKGKVVPTMADALRELPRIYHQNNFGGTIGKHPYAIQLQYALIPSDLVAGAEYFTGNSRAPSSGKQFPTRGVLQGFEFYFGNSDHHVLDFGIMPPLPNGVVRSRGNKMPTATDEFIAFQDKNRDDPIKWAVRFITLKN